jgi:hypothetical protein
MSIRRAACLAAALGSALALAPADAAARGWHGRGYGGFGAYVGPPAYWGPRPYYGGYYAPPAYFPPPVLYAPPPPVYYAPPIVTYPQPTYIVPPAGYVQPQQQAPQSLAPGVSQKFGPADGGRKR